MCFNWSRIYKSLITFSISLCLLTHCAWAGTLSLDGIWEFAPANFASLGAYETDNGEVDWQPITVPNNWYLEGHDIHGKAWYRRTFKQRLGSARDIAVLRFKGVDYLANVWVNGDHVAYHEGYFQPFEIDITEQLQNRRRHTLAVLVDSPLEVPGPSWSLRKRLIKGVLSHHDTRPGNAWSARGQERNTGGIWNSVSLETATGIYLPEFKVSPRLTFDAKGLVDAHIDIEASGKYWRGVDKADLSLELTSSAGTRQTLQLGKLTRRKSSIQARIKIEEPRLWWPRGRGNQTLYSATLIARDRRGADLHRRTVQFGLRDVRMSQEGIWRINNKRLFLKGTNYIATQWKSEMSAADYRRDIELMAGANINVVRVHAHLEAARFYTEADRAGMLVWQDFPLQWGYEDSPVFAAEASRQVGEMIHSFYNHPSIITWSLHNEPPWDATWMKWKYTDWDPDQNKQLDTELEKIARKLDTTRYIHPVSKTGEHPWFGWYSATPMKYTEPTKEIMITEFGAQALPRLSSLQKIFPNEHLWPTTKKSWALWDYHNFQHRETFETAKVEKPENLQAFITNTQNYQSKVIRIAANAYRLQRYKPLGAIFQFMFVEDWPSVNWAVVDYYRDTKPGYDTLKHAYADVSGLIEYSIDKHPPGLINVPVYAVNDLWHETQARIQIELRDQTDSLFNTFKVIRLPADAKQHVETVSKELAVGRYTLRVVTHANNQETENVYHFTVE